MENSNNSTSIQALNSVHLFHYTISLMSCKIFEVILTSPFLGKLADIQNSSVLTLCIGNGRIKLLGCRSGNLKILWSEQIQAHVSPNSTCLAVNVFAKISLLCPPHYRQIWISFGNYLITFSKFSRLKNLLNHAYGKKVKEENLSD